jgi:hypothetical protein
LEWKQAVRGEACRNRFVKIPHGQHLGHVAGSLLPAAPPRLRHPLAEVLGVEPFLFQQVRIVQVQ